jgi:hypothetical protein
VNESRVVRQDRPKQLVCHGFVEEAETEELAREVGAAAWSAARRQRSGDPLN